MKRKKSCSDYSILSEQNIVGVANTEQETFLYEDEMLDGLLQFQSAVIEFDVQIPNTKPKNGGQLSDCSSSMQVTTMAKTGGMSKGITHDVGE